MLALRLTRSAHPAVQLRRLTVTAASAGTGFLLLCALGHALSHPDTPGVSALRLAWCALPFAATVQLALAVARTDPGTRPRPGLAAIGLGPARLMAISATTTALATVVGSLLALLVFLHLRGDLTGLPFDGAAAPSLAAGTPLPLPATLTLLALLPVTASTVTALSLRPRDPAGTTPAGAGDGTDADTDRATGGALAALLDAGATRHLAEGGEPAVTRTGAEEAGTADTRHEPADGLPPTGIPPLVLDRRRAGAGAHGLAPAPADAAPRTADADAPDDLPPPAAPDPTSLPWGAALLATGLAVESYAARTTTAAPLPLPGGPTSPAAVLAGWALTVVGLALAGPGLTHLCGRLLQAARPGALRLLAGRGLMQEASRIGRPLGVLCAVASGAYSMSALHASTTAASPTPTDLAFGGPLATLGAVLVAGCALATLLTAAVEARQARADTTAALLRLGAPSTALRTAAAFRAGALAALFVPLTLTVSALAALPLTI
ncbi:hypothetical protein ACIRG4_26655 [Streptomyces sp. NPDC102395]|uniref:hypothetical protein n=1 Tax=Streptomyces sp. NPDC102395 TaxID=3366168 RepID=UPI0038143E38